MMIFIQSRILGGDLGKSMTDLNEFQTRKQLIDVLLREQGWDVNDRSQVIAEVDTKQSDFKNRDYKRIHETLDMEGAHRYLDYLLLDTNGYPLAIIEAKRHSKDSIVGKKQAEQYADDIKKNLGKDVFIFLTNGYDIRFWDRERYSVRKVEGFYSRKDLERLWFQREMVDEDARIEVDRNIVDRPKSIEITKRVIEHIHNGHRKALIVMATGTGKTRVAMAIIDVLLGEFRAQRVLFLADRKALRDQAYNSGFQEFIPHESSEKILHGIFSKEKRLYVSTIQTFQEIYTQKDQSGRYLMSPGEFDLIISDEAHRSIYNKWRDVFTYFDAIQIGLTATPADLVERDTFRFFGCHDYIPTALYSYEDAVKDGVLCDFRQSIIGAQTHFQIEGVKPSDLSEIERNRLMQLGYDPDEICFEGTELEKKVAVKGTSEAIVREFMDNCQMDQSGTLPAKTIFFAISKRHAKRIWEAFQDLYPEYKGKLAAVIVSEDSRASDLIHDFKNEPWPRVAISVDMLDTGIDVPEVCNLVFAKPVFSKIKFWQMLGRGTRADSACKHREWLPTGSKEYFMVFDFWNNFEYWQMNPEGVKNEPAEAITSRIFLLRLKQLEYAIAKGDDELFERAKGKIEADIRSLPEDSVSVRENREYIEEALSPRLWDNVGQDPLEFLRFRIMPLMRFQIGVNLKEASFTMRCERLSLAILENKEEEINRLKTSIGEMINRLPMTIYDVNQKEDLIDDALSHSFWEEPSFDDAQEMMVELGPLMKYMAKEARPPIVIDMGDSIEVRKLWDFDEDEPIYVKAFKEKVENRIKDIAESNPIIQKIQRDEPLTERDLLELERALSSPDFGVTEEVLQTHYPQARGTLVDFVRSLIGLYDAPDSVKRIEEAFQIYIAENHKEYTADQLNFIRTIQTVFMRKRHIEMTDFWEAPFTNFGINAPQPMFSEEDLSDFIAICEGLEEGFTLLESHRG